MTTRTTPSPESPSDQLLQRLTAAADALEVPVPRRDPGELLSRLVRRARRTDGLAETWLLLAAVTGVLPLEDEVRTAARRIALRPEGDAELELLDIGAQLSRRGRPARTLQVVRGAVVVDVDFCARHATHTGIQRVVRETLPPWRSAHDIVPAAWNSTYTCLRRLTEAEEQMVFDFSTDDDPDRPVEPDDAPLVVPWHSIVVLPEVPEPLAAPPLAALAQHSGNTVVAVGYDMIPVVSADLRPGPEATRFTQYLNVIKHTARVAAISRSSEAEFRGFASALEAQGLAGPAVREIVLPAAVPADGPAAHRPPGRPTVLCVGTHEPHKNHRALVHAAELLWREGLDFEVVFVGGPGWRADTTEMCFASAARRGRPIRDLGRVSDQTLSDLLAGSAFTVFVSLHEGFGLPVAESLAAGTPAIVSDFGSLAELAEEGGCLTVDPRDDDAVASAMRTLLTEPAVLGRLQQEARSRPSRTWQDYATELWDYLVESGTGGSR